MSDLQNAIFPISDQDIVRKTSKVKQLVDILQIDVASKNDDDDETNTRKKYEVFVTSSTAPVTSSLFHTVFDQDHRTQTANELLDITIGCYQGSDLVDGALDKTQGLEDEDNPGTFTGIDASGKRIFRNNVLMMREKINIYKQYAQYLLGDSSKYFTSPFEATFADLDGSALSYDERIDEAIFINIKRLFTRDAISKDNFVLKMFDMAHTTTSGSNIDIDTNDSTSVIISDNDASSSLRVTSQGGSVGTLKSSASGDDGNVGLIFYEKGIVVLDAKKVLVGSQNISGSISSVVDSFSTDAGNTTISGSFDANAGTLTFSGSMLPNLWASGSIDDLLDHICETRFKRTNATSIGFINETFINSSVYICRVAPSQANYSRNPTYTNSDGTIRVIDGLENRGTDPFAYITTVGLYDANNNLLAVAKTSRPIEKNPEIDLSISVRIDY